VTTRLDGRTLTISGVRSGPTPYQIRLTFVLDGAPLRLADAAHLRAQVPRLDRDGHAQGLQELFHRGRDLSGHPLLDLQAAGQDIDDPRDLRKTEYLPAWHVPDVAEPEEREKMVLAETVELDVLHDDHLVVGDIENRTIHNGLRTMVDRNERRDLSIFQIGLRFIERCVTNADIFQLEVHIANIRQAN
jgi:hypothetical protein